MYVYMHVLGRGRGNRERERGRVERERERAGVCCCFINNFKLLSKMVSALCRQIVLYALGFFLHFIDFDGDAGRDFTGGPYLA